jgi:hypothetical protein
MKKAQCGLIHVSRRFTQGCKTFGGKDDHSEEVTLELGLKVPIGVKEVLGEIQTI